MKQMYLLFVLSFFLTGNTFSQQKIAKSEDVSQFFLSTTYIVLSNDNMILDAYIREVIPQVWKVTPYKLITAQEFETLRTNPENSFLLFSRVTFSKDVHKNPYIYLSLLMGEPTAKKSLDPMPEIAFIPFDCETSDGELNYGILQQLLLFMQEHAQRMVKKDFRDLLGIERHRQLSAYNSNNKLLKGKTILLRQSDIDPVFYATQQANLEEKFGSQLKIVSEEEIDKALAQKTPDVVIAHTVFPELSSGKGAFTYNYLIGTDTPLLYYYAYYKANKYKGFCKTDFEVLQKNMK